MRKDDDVIIEGGATLWARQTVESEIFYDKPDVWFKIWFYLVNRVNHTKKRKWNRGECFIVYEEIQQYTKATPDQVKKCIRWLKDRGMVRTTRSTRGVTLEVLNYDHYQTLDNYYYKVKSTTDGTRKALEKHQRSTPINKNVKNVKNDNTVVATAPTDSPKKPRKKDPTTPMSLTEFVAWCRQSKQRHINIIGEYADEKKLNHTTYGQWSAFIKRNLRPAKDLSHYTDQQIGEAMVDLEEADYIKRWTLETLIKFLDK